MNSGVFTATKSSTPRNKRRSSSARDRLGLTTQSTQSTRKPQIISTNTQTGVCGTSRWSLWLGSHAVDFERERPLLASAHERGRLVPFRGHIQGFLGGQADPKSKPELRTHATAGSTLLRPQRFLADLVVGHAEYSCVINTQIQFRRCFGEVLRQRSFLFLGSSLAEDYPWFFCKKVRTKLLPTWRTPLVD